MRQLSTPASDRHQLLRWWGWLLLTTIALQLLIAVRYYAAADVDASLPAMLFRAVMLLAHFTTLTSVLLLPLLLVLVMLRPPPWIAITIAAAWSTPVLVALVIDTHVYQLYRFHINAGVLNLLFGGAAGETFEFSGAMYAQAALLVAGVAGVQLISGWLWWRYVSRVSHRPVLGRAAIAGLLGAVVSFHLLHVWADAVAYEPLLEQTEVLPLRYAATAKRTLRKLGVEIVPRPATALDVTRDSNSLAYPLSPLRCEPPGEPPHIIVLMIDSWRFDTLDAHVTPNIAAFAERTVRFTDHHSGGNATRIGVFSLFYSIPGTYWHRILAERQGPVFISELLEQGYDVQVFRSAPLFSPEFDRTVFAQVPGARLRSEGADAAERDRDLTDDFLRYIAERDASAPFFALLFYDSPHKFAYPSDRAPVFEPSADDVNYFRLHADAPAEPLLNRYRNSVHYVDSLVGEVLESLDARGMLERSVIVVTGDHGQEFDDNGHNFWGHGSNFTRYQTGVPLLVYAPGLEPAVHEYRTTHFDVMPTLLSNYLGCREPYRTYSVGRSLFEPGGRDVLLFSEYSDFAIVLPDRIAVVREQGMEVRGANYAELEGAHLTPDVIRGVLEQKTRFYRPRRVAGGRESGG